MEKVPTQARYIEWLSPDEMHQAIKEWQSELEFIKDEHMFFEDLVKSHTLQLINPEKFSHNTEVIDAINQSQKKNNFYLEAIKTHENELEILLDGVDQLEQEAAYKKEHRRLIVEINDYMKHYKSLKIQLFDIIKAIKKEDKRQRLLDRK